MLSPRDDDDDDSHLCIKCNTTIMGLDNYVKHRKERCRKKIEDTKTGISTIDPLEPTYSLGADVFFQSLELQSSVKKSSLSRLTPPIPISKPNLERKSTLAVASTSRDIPRMSPLETNLRGEDWIGGHSLRIGSNEDNQTKLINAVASISGAVKKEIPTSSYSIGYNDYKGDDDSEESEEMEDDDDDEEIHPIGGKWKPPPNYTGGKWRPASPEHEEWEIQENTEGKWKSFLADTNERDDDYDAPPPGHTKGKWVPGAHEKTQIMQPTLQNKGSVQYWCGPCNRRLGSRAIYEKHLMSSLHMRKVLPEHELEFSGHLEPVRNIAEKRTTRPSRFVDESIYTQSKLKKSDPAIKIEKTDLKEKKKRKRKPLYVQCSGCKSRVRSHLMGKHLISHYHFRKTTDTDSPNYKQLILNNITAVVRQSPFQCSPCNFYTNWLSNFMQHWYSEDHEKKMMSIDGRFWCSFCKFECETSPEMLEHLNGTDHTEVIAAINRSMPIIIRKKSVFRCGTCYEEFRYNMEVKRHCIKTGHQLCYSATDDYQEFHKCQHCNAKFKSSLALAAHLKNKHKQKAFLCLVCSRSFSSAAEAKIHRYTSDHRVRKKENLKKRGLTIADISKKCPHCPEKLVLKNVLELKDHIAKVHPDKKRKCPKCGMAFIFPQEVSRHVRINACQFPHTPLNAAILWNCSQCLFSTDSQAECLFHEVLHSTPEVYKVDEKEKMVVKYTCPICPRNFSKSSLRRHLRQHTSERPFKCTICNANYTRESSLNNHIKNVHGSGAMKMPKILETIEEPEREKFACGKCKTKFNSKSSLARHMPFCFLEEVRHCPHEGCIYVATSRSQLARHTLSSHGERIKHHECPHCLFKSDQSSHLKRHLRCHAGLKPYFCPHCEFTCGSLENLRKHVLRSGRHSGLFLYKCKFCEYETNMAAELKNHLLMKYPDKYNAKTALEAVKTHLMKTSTSSN